MSRISPRFILTWLVTSLVTMVIWFVIPGGSTDRGFFGFVSGGLAEEGAKTEGGGTHAKPWRLVSQGSKQQPANMPASIALKDNLDDIFQGSPHAPIDLAVIFNNMQRLGTRKLASSVLLAWDNPDAIGLAALEGAMAEFESVVLAAPVTRGAVMESMPTGFRNASVPADGVAGDLTGLPLVNRVSIPNLIHGGDNALLGFEVIDSAPTEDRVPLMARWDDRVIFSFPVVVIIQQLGIKPTDLRIKVGSHLQFGDQGAKIPIDEFGHLNPRDTVDENEADLLAEELIDAETGDDTLPYLTHAILCDFRSHGDITSRDFNRMIPISVAAMSSTQGKAVELEFVRISSVWEMALLLLWVTAMASATLLNRPWVGLAGLLAYPVIAVVLWIGVHNGTWFPGIAAMASVIIAQGYAACTGVNRKRTTSMPRLDRLEFEAEEPHASKDAEESHASEETEKPEKPTESSKAPDKPGEEQDYALPPKG